MSRAALALGLLAAAPAAQQSRWWIWDDAPATRFTEAAPVGNARLGGLVFGGTAEERIVLNESSLAST